ncbi:MAG TPA: hypothetical protein VFN31_02085 [Candidatus Saccharimonadales bacterium]|nr:hypothetical protein [Candidatus Saccharimonadales bacterium]
MAKSNQLNRWLKHTLSTIEAAVVIIDLNPILSEPIRFGSLFATIAITNNVLASALVFGGTTLILDMLGAIATADLLAKKRATSLIEGTKRLITRTGFGRVLNLKTGLASDFSITLLVGTPITIILKQMQDQSRTREQNLKLGIELSFAASVVSAVQGGAMVTGLWQPSPAGITLTILAVVSLLAIPTWLKKRFTQE